MILRSSAFEPGSEIPRRFTCEGEDCSPPLEWSGVPSASKSLALLVDDPDAPDPAAPTTRWVHWLGYDLPVSSTGISDAMTSVSLPRGSRVGVNDWGRTRWGGPCPPVGRHRYVFRLFALDTSLGGLDSPNRADFENAIRGHVVAEAELVGTYQRGSAASSP